jgi:CubicO group peptidase (beta-lactamase class C family)
MNELPIDRSLIHGKVSPGFEEVQKQFVRNFTERGELGAACAVYHKGRKVVDLWGGYRDHRTGAPFEDDTLIIVYSTTKGIAALTLALAHSRGLLDYEERVATYWPEFAQAGKENITVRQLIAHQAGLCAIDEPITLDVMADPDRLAGVLARQRPAFEPGSRYAYHTWTMGWYESEIIRRVDPKHRTLGQFFQDEIAEPLDLEFYIGLPSDVPDSRIAAIKGVRTTDVLLHFRKFRTRFVMAFFNPRSLTSRTMRNPNILGRDNTKINRREILSLEFPSGNGIGQVRSVAKLYGEFAAGGKTLGIQSATLDALMAPAVLPPRGYYDQVWREDMCYSLGFLKPYPRFPFGSGDRAYGFPGAGGSFAYGDPDAETGFAYAMTCMGFRAMSQPRQLALRAALKRCLEKTG